MKEIWRKIKRYPNYRISNKGRVKNIKTNNFLKPHVHSKKNNYTTIYLSNGKRSKNFSLARLVMKYFPYNAVKKDVVTHLNWKNEDNKRKNLKWNTYGDNYRHARQGKIRGIHKWSIGNNKWRAVIVEKQKRKTIGYFLTYEEACIAYHNRFVELYNHSPFSLLEAFK